MFRVNYFAAFAFQPGLDMLQYVSSKPVNWDQAVYTCSSQYEGDEIVTPKDNQAIQYLYNSAKFFQEPIKKNWVGGVLKPGGWKWYDGDKMPDNVWCPSAKYLGLKADEGYAAFLSEENGKGCLDAGKKREEKYFFCVTPKHEMIVG